MAEPTKAEIQAENDKIMAELEQLRTEHAEMSAQYVDMKAKYESSPYATDANYQREIERLTKRAANTEAELKALREKTEREQYERDVIAEDKRRAEEEIMRQYRHSAEQTEHTRYRLLGQAPAGQRDIFGDPNSQVFDLGVDLQDFWGSIYIPLDVVIEMGQSIGMLTKEQANEIKHEIELKTAQIEAASGLAQELISGVTANIDRFYAGIDSVVLSDNEGNADESGTAGTDSPESETGTAADRIAALRAKSGNS